MRNICFINFDMTVHGGAQRVLVNIVKSISHKYNVHVVSLIAENGECKFDLGDEVKYETILPYKARIRQTIMGGGKKLRNYLNKNNIEVVFYVGAYAGLCGSVMARRCRMKKVFCDHGALLNQWHEKPARIMRTVGSKLSDITVVLTEQSRMAYLDKIHRKPERVITIYNWIDEQVIEKSGPYDSDSRSIITVGRFSHEKGYDLLVETAKKMLELNQDWTWEIYGDGDMMPEIKSKIAEYGLERHVLLKGATNHIYECYQGHALYVLTSYREGLPLVLLEAKANHIPLVSFDIISGPREIIDEEKDGILIPPYDTEVMAKKITQLLDDKARRIQMSEAASNNLNLFSKEDIMKKWMDLIERIDI